MLVINGKEVFNTIEELVNPKYTALLLIDIQNDYVTPGGYFDKMGFSSALREIVPNIKRVLEAARHSNVLVIHVQMTFYPDRMAESPAALRGRMLRIGYKSGDSAQKLLPYCIDGTWGWQIVDELAPLPNEIVIRKHRGSAFVGTDLDMLLRSNGISAVAIVGLVTHGCVISTTIDAQFFDYYPVILRDCIGSHKAPLHDAGLVIMSNSRDVVDSRQVLEVWDEGGP
ncbi:MAG: cysteine hydrolase [Deltaproteobacteria bacterium]|nr:MAG: cysteine hydrolase [Deltaproteobacteria bacterium]